MSGVTMQAVTEDEADIRLDRWFRRHYPGVTQGVIQRLCRTGQVRVDGARAEASTRLSPGQSVRIPPLPAATAATAAAAADAPHAADPKVVAELERMVLYRDDKLIVLNKPAGLATQGGPGISRHLDRMLAAWPDRPRLVHRLDRETSGVIVVARTPGVAAKLAAGFRGRTMEKVYWAIVVGRPVPVEGRIDMALARRAPGPGGARVAPAERGEDDAAHAITDFRTLDHAGRKFAWLELHPLTGRTHQLRVHCAAIGAPILGDEAYGAPREPGDALNDDMLHLHARRLTLPHPDGGTLTVEAELPPHMATTFRTLGFTAPPPAPPRRR
jgi:23S rRNA pseudouridine955/2504/2580 synthase